MVETKHAAYSGLQILLHWTIVALLLVQLLSADGMSTFFEPAEDSGTAPGIPRSGTALIHAAGGTTILVLMLVRLAVRLHHGPVRLPADMSRASQLLARANHHAFYVVLVLLPISGAASILVTPQAGDLHEALKNLLYVLVGAHLAGVIFHLFIRRDGVIWRMVPLRR